MALNKGLGRGLDALFQGSGEKSAENQPPQTLPLELVEPNPEQPRRIFEENALAELAESIRRQGLLQPLLVRPVQGSAKYQLVAGERRWRAAGLAGLVHVPVIVRELDDAEAMACALIENLQREDLNPMEEARALKKLKDTLDLSQEELARKLGKSRPAVANSMRLLALPEEACADVEAGRLSCGHARCLLGLEDPEAQEELRRRILEQNLTVREAESAVAGHKARGCFPWAQEKKPPRSSGGGNSAELAPLSEALTQNLGCRARLHGNTDKGRITISYSSPAQLLDVLRLLGIQMDARDTAGEA